MKYGSLFSGCGLFDLGLTRANLECQWLCEIDPDARRVLAKHHPDLSCHGDIRGVGKRNTSHVDLIVGGFPCQSVSVAGKRAGLADENATGLFFEMARVIDELRPAYCLFENVPGLLSSFSPIEPPPEPVEGREWEVEEDSDFETVLSTLAAIGYCGAVTGLDAQFFGVAQQRLRLFGLFARSDIGARRCAEILAFSNRRAGHPQKGRKKKPGVAYGLAASARGTGNDGHGQGRNSNYVTGCLRADSPSRYGDSCSFVTHALMSVGHDASENGTGRGTPLCVQPYNIVGLSQQGKNHAYPADKTGAIQHKGNSASGKEAGTVVCFQERGRDGDVNLDTQENLSYALTSPKGGGRSQERCLAKGMMVRRLTPTECLRLMGAPDDFLDLDPPLSDSAKYRLCGNGVVVSVASWLGERLKKAFSGV